MSEKTCKSCGKKFNAKFNRTSYCSEKCKYGTGVCRVCGKEFVRKKKTTGEYCSTRCWYESGDTKLFEYKRCSSCGVEKQENQFPFSGGKGELSPQCKDCHSEKYTERANRVRKIKVSIAIPDFPKRILDTRQSLGMNQGEFGKLFGVGVTQVRLWEKGKSLPVPKRARAIFEHFGWEIPKLLSSGPDNRIPLGVKACKNCAEEFPIYRLKTEFCSRICNNRFHSGNRSSTWRGGKIFGGGGYIKIKNHSHPNSDKNGYVFEHTLVMSEKIGRQLFAHEYVHHKNGIRDDNRIENLELWATWRKDPAGQRVEDLIDFVVTHFRKDVEAKLSETQG